MTYSIKEYTLSKVKPSKGLPLHVLESRMEQGAKLRAMYRSMGLSRAQCAQFLHVSLRTLQNWESGTHPVPFAAFKLMRIHCGMELPGSAWVGWSISRGMLCTPEGHELNPRDAAWWSLLVRRAETGVKAIAELAKLRALRRTVRRRGGDSRPLGLVSSKTSLTRHKANASLGHHLYDVNLTPKEL